jgi:hypothetical protein
VIPFGEPHGDFIAEETGVDHCEKTRGDSYDVDESDVDRSPAVDSGEDGIISQ